MNGLDNLLGMAEAALVNAKDAESLKPVLSAVIKALKSVSEELRTLKDDAAELNEYVNRMDDDLSELEFLHEDELDTADNLAEDDFLDDFDPEPDDDDPEDGEERPDGEEDEENSAKGMFKIWRDDRDGKK